MSDIAGPGAESIVQPGESQDAKDRANRFVEKLFQRAPEAAEAALR
jgi:hypothetical protein